MGETFRIEIPITVDDNTEPGISRATKKLSSFEKAMKDTEDRLGKMKNSKVELALTAVDKASSVIKKVKDGAAGLMGKAWRTTVSIVDKATAPLKGILGRHVVEGLPSLCRRELRRGPHVLRLLRQQLHLCRCRAAHCLHLGHGRLEFLERVYAV